MYVLNLACAQQEAGARWEKSEFQGKSDEFLELQVRRIGWEDYLSALSWGKD